MNKNQKGFGAVEALLILILVGILGFTSWYIWQAKNKTNNTYNSAGNVNSVTPKQTITNFNECKSSAGSKILTTYPEVCVTKGGKHFTQTTAQSTNTQYLSVKEFGIKIPLTSTTSDLGYTYLPVGGYNSLPVALLGSRTLAQEAANEDPTDCTQAYFNKSNGLYPISYIYSTRWEVGGGGGQGIPKSSVTVSNKSYYWYELNSAAGCNFSGTHTFSNHWNAYYNAVLNSFPSAIAL